ncbi:MAG TPA: TetR/AcrR family transcriptional regulator [Arenibaculum sp.]|nr:TetR/AcrR family transcriptional regulator [Arenibaculum sp.]
MRDTPVKWRRRKEARPSEILSAALDVFSERGFAATKLDDVAARSGISKGTLYLYFPNKQELFKAVVREALLPNIERIERMVGDFPGPSTVLLERFVETVTQAVAASRIGAIPKLVIAEAGNFPDLARFYLDEVIHRGFGLIAAILRRGIDRGEFRQLDVDLTVRLVIAPVLMHALWRNSLEPYEERKIDTAALTRTHLDLLFHGLIARGGGS